MEHKYNLNISYPTRLLYGGFLTEQQVEVLERIKANILRAIYGPDVGYRKCLKKSGLCTLSQRGELLFARFAKRIENHTGFAKKWLPQAKGT